MLEKRTRLKPSTIRVYIEGLKNLCAFSNLDNPFELVEKLQLEQIETLTEEWIRQNEHSLAPKYLNLVYCSVKTWCKATRLIKSRRLFREIDFDKSSRKTEALTEAMVTSKNIKDIFDILPIEDKIDIGLYALCGLRPTLIPQLKVKHFHERSAHIENGKLKIDRKPSILIITRLNDEGKPRQGNKGNITFFVFVPTKIAELIETRLNIVHNEVTSETPLAEAHNDDAMYFKVKEAFRKIGFKGRPYLLRSFADRILDRITKQFNEEDLKEFMMGHKGKISAVYQIKGIIEESEKEYRDMYVKACDNWINEQIFGTVNKEELTIVQALTTQAMKLGVPTNKISEIQKLLESGKLTFNQFDQELTKLTQEALDTKMEQKFDQLLTKALEKRNGNNTSA